MLTKSQADKLGNSLRKGPEPPSSEDQAAYADYRALFEPSLTEVQEAILREFGAPVASARLKTRETAVLKLRRQKTKLSRMGDIAGCRIVVDTLTEQDDAARRIAELFPEAEIRDLRENDHWGYRAVHVYVMAQGYPVEVQVRTLPQNIWANMSESIAYAMGLDIKYGGGPKAIGVALMQLSATAAGLDDQRTTIRRLADRTAGLRTAYQEYVAKGGPEDKAREREIDETAKQISEVARQIEDGLLNFERESNSLVELIGAPR